MFADQDHLFVNGVFHCLDPGLSRAGVLAVRGGVIRYAGDSLDQARAFVPAGCTITDLGGSPAYPGFTDAHLHFLSQGQRLSELDLTGLSREEILHSVRLAARSAAPDKWILGRGWSNEIWPGKAWPGREELDAAAPVNPVALTRCDSHSMWVNSAALEAAGIDRHSPDLPGGEIWRSENGEPAGILVDTPIFLIWSAIPPLREEEKILAWHKAQAELFAFGVTGIADAWQYDDDLEILQRAYAGGRLGIRLSGMLGAVDREGNAAFRPGMPPLRDLYGQRLSRDMFKLVLDGSLGSRSAWLSRDYADRPGHRGSGRYTDEELLALAQAPARAGFRLCLHAIGDAAVEQALRVYAVLGRPGHRIEHFQMASPDQIRRAGELGVIAGMQTRHEAADKDMAQLRLDRESLAISYPWRGVLDGGGIIANGSDSPVEAPNPFPGMAAAVTRTPFAGLDQPLESLRLTRLEALLSYTVWPAMAEGREHARGRLMPGMLADFTVTDRDILTCPAEELADTRVLLTVVGGQVVYE